MHEFNSCGIFMKVEKDKMPDLLALIVEEILFFCGSGRVEAEKTRLQRKAGRHFIRVNKW